MLPPVILKSQDWEQLFPSFQRLRYPAVGSRHGMRMQISAFESSQLCVEKKRKETYIFVKTCSKGTLHPQLGHHRDRQIMPGARAPNAICPAGGARVNC